MRQPKLFPQKLSSYLKEIEVKFSAPLKSALVVSGLTFSAGAAAQEAYGVSYKASELRTAKGVGAVHARIVNIAREYCPSYREAGSLREVKLCLEDVTNDLVGKINHPSLSSYHSREAGVVVAGVSNSDADRG